MKVLHVIPSVSPAHGGPSFVLRALTQGLSERGVEVHVATTDDNGAKRLSVPLGQPIREQGVTYWYFPRQARFYTCSVPFTKWLTRHIGEFDLVHIHYLFSYCSSAASWIARRQCVPYIIRPLGVLNCWGMQNRRPKLKKLSFRLLESHFLAHAALIHYTSEQERAEASQLGVTQRSVIIPNPAEVPTFTREELLGAFRSQRPELEGRRIILFLSRLDPKKGLDLLLPAFALVRARHPQTVLHLVGSGEPSFVFSLKQIAERLGIGSAVLWGGFLAGKEKWAALADAEVFVLPSYSENFGVAVLDALTFRVPVVVSDQVAVQSEISAAKAGLVVPCKVGALANAISQLLIAPELCARLAANGEALVSQRFSPRAVINQLTWTYQELLGKERVSNATIT